MTASKYVPVCCCTKDCRSCSHSPGMVSTDASAGSKDAATRRAQGFASKQGEPSVAGAAGRRVDGDRAFGAGIVAVEQAPGGARFVEVKSEAETAHDVRDLRVHPGAEEEYGVLGGKNVQSGGGGIEYGGGRSAVLEAAR